MSILDKEYHEKEITWVLLKDKSEPECSRYIYNLFKYTISYVDNNYANLQLVGRRLPISNFHLMLTRIYRAFNDTLLP